MASSSTSAFQKSFSYDVFLSFRGEDTRRNFVDHLYAALERQGIRTYKDDKRIEKGKQIKDGLIKSIEDSKLFIIVFSKNYASSSWCLDELVKIMECHKNTNQKAYPVFYDVEPTEIRKQRGPVRKASSKHINEAATGKGVCTCIAFLQGESTHAHKDEVAAEKWREALKEAANLAGWELKNTANGHEAKFIKRVVEEISLELRSIRHSVDEKLVGMNSRIKDVLSILENDFDEVRMMGIKGIGGGGKTTLARVIFDGLRTQFDSKSFVENVREVSKGLSGLKSLQEKLLKSLLKEKEIELESVDDGKSMMEMRLRSKKILVVLDDVDHKDQLEALAGDPSWFKPGSVIIITTRDEQVLIAHRVKFKYDVNLLSDEEAIQLFNMHAFGRSIPNKEFERESLEVVCYAGGLPLTIKVLGSFLCGKDMLEWMDALERLKTIPLKETLNILELSYISLEDDYKEIFLDVACFLKGFPKEHAIDILECCGFRGRIGLRVFELKSLITISKDQNLGMHDCIQDMGRHIVRRLHPYDPRKHSRLWINEEVEEILANRLGTEMTTGMAVDSFLSSEGIAQGFGDMKSLRFLRMPSKEDDNNHTSIPNFPKMLRYLSWHHYPHLSLPNSFQLNNLVGLDMYNSRMEKLWEGEEKKVLKNLRFLDLSFSKLTSLDLGPTPNLEKLNLKYCEFLVELHLPDGCLQRLVSLNLTFCTRVKSLLFIRQLKSLQVLKLACLSLNKFPYIIPDPKENSLLELQIGGNDINELPSSIGNHQKLVYFDLEFCNNLMHLPGSICDLRHLRNLKFNNSLLMELPEDIGRLECLEELKLSNSCISHLPKSICNLKRLKTLNLSHCWLLENLPEDIGQLESLQVLNLESSRVRYIPDSLCELRHLKYLCLLYCFQFATLPERFETMECLEELNLKGTRITHLPQSILLLKGLKVIT